MKMIKRSFLICLAICLVLTGCAGKQLVSVERFAEAANEIGFETGIIDTDAYAEDADKGVSVVYLVEADKEYAKEVFEGTKEELNALVEKSQGHNTSSEASGDYQKYTMDADGTYGVIIRLGKVLIIGDSSTPEGRKMVEDLISALGY